VSSVSPTDLKLPGSCYPLPHNKVDAEDGSVPFLSLSSQPFPFPRRRISPRRLRRSDPDVRPAQKLAISVPTPERTPLSCPILHRGSSFIPRKPMAFVRAPVGPGPSRIVPPSPPTCPLFIHLIYRMNPTPCCRLLNTLTPFHRSLVSSPDQPVRCFLRFPPFGPLTVQHIISFCAVPPCLFSSLTLNSPILPIRI